MYFETDEMLRLYKKVMTFEIKSLKILPQNIVIRFYHGNYIYYITHCINDMKIKSSGLGKHNY